MATYYVDYSSTVNKNDNDSLFMDNHKATLLELHKRVRFEEEVKGYSYIQYSILDHHMAYTYCLILFFLVLERLADQTIEQSELIRKSEFQFKVIQEIMAHKGIDIHRMYEDIKIIYSPIDFATGLITNPHYEA